VRCVLCAFIRSVEMVPVSEFLATSLFDSQALDVEDEFRVWWDIGRRALLSIA